IDADCTDAEQLPPVAPVKLQSPPMASGMMPKLALPFVCVAVMGVLPLCSVQVKVGVPSTWRSKRSPPRLMVKREDESTSVPCTGPPIAPANSHVPASEVPPPVPPPQPMASKQIAM